MTDSGGVSAIRQMIRWWAEDDRWVFLAILVVFGALGWVTGSPWDWLLWVAG